MPWLSKKQRAWGHTKAGLKALGGKDKVAEWDQATGKRKLPNRVAKKIKKKVKVKK